MLRKNFTSSFNTHIHQIHQHQQGNFLYLGDYQAALDVKMLKQKNIKTVLTTAAGLPLDYKNEDINHIVYNALDIPTYNISKHFSDSYQQLQNGLKNGCVFVHCAAGISRSATIVIAYLMKKYTWTFNKTVNYVRSKRKIIWPNEGFQRHLRNLQRTLKKEINPLSNTVSGSVQVNQKKNSDQKYKDTFGTSLRSVSTTKKPFDNNYYNLKKSSVPPYRNQQINNTLKIVTIKK